MSASRPALPSTELSGAYWRKSSYSGGANECVEVADLTATAFAVAVIRDSKDPQGPVLCVGSASFMSFIRNIRGGSRAR